MDKFKRTSINPQGNVNKITSSNLISNFDGKPLYNFGINTAKNSTLAILPYINYT